MDKEFFIDSPDSFLFFSLFPFTFHDTRWGQSGGAAFERLPLGTDPSFPPHARCRGCHAEHREASGEAERLGWAGHRSFAVGSGWQSGEDIFVSNLIHVTPHETT